ncbi:MAG: hypothetical protein LBI56_02175 [Puniceicoccales bacterium]|jgi:hypothetical protein|nr:hypothetical protein [Puniceicoccales bacterium]
MNAANHLNLESAHWRRVGNYGYPVLELKIDGKNAHIYDLNFGHVMDGFVHLADLEFKTDWKSILPHIKLSEKVASAHGLPTELEGATNDPVVLKLATDFWNALGTREGFENNRQVYPFNS